jgi:pimeloyl-ACP methyl ester carboxylesterase
VDATARASVRLSEQDAFAAYFESWSGGDFAQAASAITHEVLVIAGAQDGGVPEAWLRATWLAHLPRARIAVMPEAGHYPMDECPLMSGSVIAAFLDPG